MEKKPIFDMKAFQKWNIKVPLIQGGMGVGVSLSGLAGAVAAEGGIGIISTAQIGFAEPDFENHEEECNLRGIRKHIQRAKEIAGGEGMVGVNVMVALQHYKEHVREAVRAGADVVICGAGLPMDLPELVKGSLTKIAPVVSSKRAIALLLKSWDKKYRRVPDFIVVEGPEAGGHLGFSKEQLSNTEKPDFAMELKEIIGEKKKYEEKYRTDIPVFMAGGSGMQQMRKKSAPWGRTAYRQLPALWRRRSVTPQKPIRWRMSMQSRRRLKLSKVRWECRDAPWRMNCSGRWKRKIR